MKVLFFVESTSRSCYAKLRIPKTKLDTTVMQWFIFDLNQFHKANKWFDLCHSVYKTTIRKYICNYLIYNNHQYVSNLFVCFQSEIIFQIVIYLSFLIFWNKTNLYTYVRVSLCVCLSVCLIVIHTALLYSVMHVG